MLTKYPPCYFLLNKALPLYDIYNVRAVLINYLTMYMQKRIFATITILALAIINIHVRLMPRQPARSGRVLT